MIILVFLVLSWLGSNLSLGLKLPEGMGVAAPAREDGNKDRPGSSPAPGTARGEEVRTRNPLI